MVKFVSEDDIKTYKLSHIYNEDGFDIEVAFYDRYKTDNNGKLIEIFANGKSGKQLFIYKNPLADKFTVVQKKAESVEIKKYKEAHQKYLSFGLDLGQGGYAYYDSKAIEQREERNLKKFRKKIGKALCSISNNKVKKREDKSSSVTKLKLKKILEKNIKMMEEINWDYWIKQKNLCNDEPYYILLGFNPNYFQLSDDEKRELEIYAGDNYGFENINIFLKKNVERLKRNVKWNNNWQDFSKQCYEKHVFSSQSLDRFDKILSQDFCNFLKTKYKLSYFDKYLNFELYRPNYDEWFGKSTISQEQAVCLILGLEPEYYKLYRKYFDIISNDINSSIISLKDNEKIFFFRSYKDFLDESRLSYNIKKNYKLINKFKYQGNLEKFINRLYNEGFIFDDYLTNYLKSKSRFPEYGNNSMTYISYKEISAHTYWTGEEALIFILGKEHPKNVNSKINIEQSIYGIGDILEKEPILTFLKNGDDNADYYTYSAMKRQHEIRCNSGTSYSIEEFFKKYIDSAERKYGPKEILKCFREHTPFVIPEILKDLVFGEKLANQEILKPINNLEIGAGTNLNLIIQNTVKSLHKRNNKHPKSSEVWYDIKRNKDNYLEIIADISNLYEIKWKVADTADEKVMNKKTFQNLVSNFRIR